MIDNRKGRILEELRDREYIQTNQVADLLDVSRNTALSYLSELADEGTVERVGELGRNVRYRLPI